MTSEQFIEKAKQVHQDKYRYEEVSYKRLSVNVKIICPKHGLFEQRPEKHLNGQGCPLCNPKHKLSTKEYIEKAQKTFGDKYDYSELNYTNNRTNVNIICHIHGSFKLRADSHLAGRGCPKCVKEDTFKTYGKLFIEKSKKIHQDKYDYSLVTYVDTHTLVNIICSQHGIFKQTPLNHLLGYGCPTCGGTSKLSTDQFIERAKKIHQDKYNYNQVNYVNSRTPVNIICYTHGVFEQSPQCHLRGQGCPKCAKVGVIEKNTYTLDKFKEKAKQKHQDKYDYSLVNYLGSRTKIKIICPKHGVFEQTPHTHLQGKGCPKCSSSHKLTTEEFIEKAKIVHQDKYNYSLVNYTGYRKKIKIICHTHGIFEQTPDIHLQGSGCPKCCNTKVTTEQFIYKAKQVHQDKYNYSLVNYKNVKEKVEIICNVHGSFFQTPNSHLNGQGCPKCSPKHTFTTTDFIEKAKQVHQDKYDYSQVKYVSYREKVNILCPKHGLFEQTPDKHLQGQGCYLCSKDSTSLKLSFTTEQFIEKAKKIHQDKYDYSQVKYVNAKHPVKIICSEHGLFEQTPDRHLRGSGCILCIGAKNTVKFPLTTEQFIDKAKQVHSDKYEYSLVNYKNNTEKVKIICPKHGVFEQTPKDHLRGNGCPICKQPKGERLIYNYLKENNIQFETQKKFQELGKLSYDFYIPSKNVLIEFNGIQHYEFKKFFHKDLHAFHYQKHRDWLKRKYATVNGYMLLVIHYKDVNNIGVILNNFLK